MTTKGLEGYKNNFIDRSSILVIFIQSAGIARLSINCYFFRRGGGNQTCSNTLVLFSVYTLETLGKGIQPQRMEIHMCHDSSRLSPIWMTFTYVCVDSSRTVLEHHRPFHSHVSLILCDEQSFFFFFFFCSISNAVTVTWEWLVRWWWSGS